MNTSFCGFTIISDALEIQEWTQATQSDLFHQSDIILDQLCDTNSIPANDIRKYEKCGMHRQ